MRTSTALVLIGLGALGLSFAAPLVKWISLGPTTIGVYRMGLASLALALMVPVGGRKALGGVGRGRGLAWSAFAGLCFAADLFVWHRSIVLAGSGIATLLAHTQVFWVALLSAALLGEKLRPAFVASVLLAMGGVVLVSLPGMGVNALHLQGIGLGLATGVFYAGYVLALRESRRGEGLVGLVPNLLVSAATCGVALLLAALLTGEHVTIPGGADLALLVALGLGVHVGGWLLISGGMPHVPATSSSVLLLLQPVLATVWGVWFFDEPVGWLGTLGVGLTLLGVWGAQRARLASG